MYQTGFNRVMGGTSISLLLPEELELLVCGTPDLNFHELEEVCKYEGGYDEKHPTVRAFWETVHEMDLASQRKLLMFVTGSYKSPIGGLRNLNLLIQRAGPDSNHLPTAHTCTYVVCLIVCLVVYLFFLSVCLFLFLTISVFPHPCLPALSTMCVSICLFFSIPSPYILSSSLTTTYRLQHSLAARVPY